MLHDNKNKTFYLDNEDAMLVLGKKEYNNLRNSGDLYFVNMKSLKPKKERTVQSLFSSDKIRTSNKRVICVETGEVFDSIKAVSMKYGCHGSNICAVCKGKAKTACGYHWEYA